MSTTFILNFGSKSGSKSGKSRHGTGYPEQAPAAHTRHFGGRVPPLPRDRSMIHYVVGPKDSDSHANHQIGRSSFQYNSSDGHDTNKLSTIKRHHYIQLIEVGIQSGQWAKITKISKKSPKKFPKISKKIPPKS